MGFLTMRPAALAAGLLLTAVLPEARAIEPYQAKTIEPYQAKTIDPYQANTIAPVQGRQVRPVEAAPVREHRAAGVQKYQGAGQARLFTQKDREEMHRNDVAAGRTRESMSRGQAGGSAAEAQSRANHYSNMQNLNNRMNESGTIGYNPFRNQ